MNKKEMEEKKATAVALGMRDLRNESWGRMSDAEVEFSLERSSPTMRLNKAFQLPISDKSVVAIMNWENSADPRKYKSKPQWPAGVSGVTIGFGYDLGYRTRKKFYDDWSDILDPETMKRLEKAIDKKGGKAKELAKELKDIDISYDEARFVLMDRILPEQIKKTFSVYPEAENLHPDSQGALVSMIFNRGPGLNVRIDPKAEKKEQEKQRAAHETLTEKRLIRGALATKNFESIPKHLDKMKRLASDGSWNWKRRQGEAKLFREGLDQSQVLDERNRILYPSSMVKKSLLALSLWFGILAGSQCGVLPPNPIEPLPVKKIEERLLQSGNTPEVKEMIAEIWEAELALVYIQLASELSEMDQDELEYEQTEWRNDFGAMVKDLESMKKPVGGAGAAAMLLEERVNQLRARLKAD